MTVSVKRLGDDYDANAISSEVIKCRCGARLLDVEKDLSGFAKIVTKCPRCKCVCLVHIKQ